MPFHFCGQELLYLLGLAGAGAYLRLVWAQWRGKRRSGRSRALARGERAISDPLS